MSWKSCFSVSWLMCPDLFSVGISYWNFKSVKTRILCRVEQCQKMLFEKISIFSFCMKWLLEDNSWVAIYSVLSFRVPDPLSWACCSKVSYLHGLHVVWQGDFTRTGERKLAGVMKDGVNSANRYYLNRFRDAYRQAVIGKSTISTKLSYGV